MSLIKGMPDPEGPELTNVLTKCLFGLYSTYVAPAEGHTVLAMFEIECEAIAFKIMIPNISDAAVPGVRAAIAVGTGFDKPTHWITPSTPPGGSGWLPLKASGQDSATLAPKFSDNVASWTEFDLAALRTLPEANGGRPIVAVRIQYPAGAIVTYPANGIYGWRVDDGVHRILRASKQDVLGIDNLAAYTTTASVDDQVAIPIVQYVTVKQGRQELVCGDSTTEGIGSTVRCYGAVQRAADLLSTSDTPVEYCNSGMYAQGPLVYSKALGYYAGKVQPTTVFYSPYSINNTPAGGMPPYAVDEDYFGLARVLTDLRALPRPPDLYLLEGLPTNPAYRDTGAGDSARRDLNTFMTTVGGAKVVPGYAAAFTGTRLANGQDLIKDGLTADDVHPNDAGYDLLAQKVMPLMR